MSRSTADLLDSALRLPGEDRALLASELIASLDGTPEAAVEEAWDAEVARRGAQVDSGKASRVSRADVTAEVSCALKRR